MYKLRYKRGLREAESHAIYAVTESLSLSAVSAHLLFSQGIHQCSSG